MSYEDFLAIVRDSYDNDSDIRLGQHFFNALHTIRPDIANQIRGTKNDPFYRDDVPGYTQEAVSALWS